MSSNFENLDVWKRSCRLSVELWQLLKNSNEYWLKEQMLRSALSIPSNIAEGCERNSKAEFRRFINIAKGSAAELRTQAYIAVETGILKKESIEKFIEELKAITKMLQALINSSNR
ncbi:MAG: four helix bundle protein [Planctomycetes bacterium RBG_13_44_8b]|nr:MAG: four helix bundle protein [Planctomycetes bacterium RBG_13_44_8b]